MKVIKLNKYQEENNNINYLIKNDSNIKVKKYVLEKLRNLYVKTLENEGYADKMISKMLLNGYCWQSTSSIISFFNDEDEILRGIIKPSSTRELRHAWIKFEVFGNEYILDSSIGVTVPKVIYDDIMKPKIEGRIQAKVVKNTLIDIISNNEYHKMPLGDINSPFYRKDIKIKGKQLNKKIKSLSVKYPE